MMTNKEKKVLWVAGTLLVACCMGLSAWFVYGTAETVTVTVTKTERITTGSGDSMSSKYLVFTSGETFENSDCLWYGKFNSSDFQGRLTPGTYSMKVYGWRIPFLSSYRNIVEVSSR